jgi:hypothetical protein
MATERCVSKMKKKKILFFSGRIEKIVKQISRERATWWNKYKKYLFSLLVVVTMTSIKRSSSYCIRFQRTCWLYGCINNNQHINQLAHRTLIIKTFSQDFIRTNPFVPYCATADSIDNSVSDISILLYLRKIQIRNPVSSTST